MTGLRGAKAANGVQTPLLLVASALLLLLVLTLLRYHLRQKRTKQRLHEPLQLYASAPSGELLSQISRRKEDLNRFIGRLRAQLEVREQQLRSHDELEEIVTSRVESSHRQDKDWRKIMKAGKKLHGKNWNVSKGEEPSLREMMELHKDELLEYKDVIKEKFLARAGARATSRGPRIMQLPVSQSIPIVSTPARRQQDLSFPPGVHLETSQPPTAPIPTKIVPPQWQSTRRVAGRQDPSTGRDTVDGLAVLREAAFAGGGRAGVDLLKPTASVLRLDLSKLSDASSSSTATTTSSISLVAPAKQPSSQGGDDSTPRKSFELTFQRQAQFATMLKKK